MKNIEEKGKSKHMHSIDRTKLPSINFRSWGEMWSVRLLPIKRANPAISFLTV